MKTLTECMPYKYTSLILPYLVFTIKQKFREIDRNNKGTIDSHVSSLFLK